MPQAYRITSITRLTDSIMVNGTCHCGSGANMVMMSYHEGSGFYPRCDPCVRWWVASVPITEDVAQLWEIELLMES